MRRIDMFLPHLGNSSNYLRGWVIWMRYWNSKNEDSNTYSWTDYITEDGINEWAGMYQDPKMFSTKANADAWLKKNRKRIESDPSRFNCCKSYWPDTFRYDIRLCRFLKRLVIVTEEDRRIFGGANVVEGRTYVRRKKA